MTSHVFLAIFDLPTFSYSIMSDLGGYFGSPYLPYNRTSLMDVPKAKFAQEGIFFVLQLFAW